MKLTHEQAHRLIQLNMDKALQMQELSMLSEHLRSCPECQRYANEIKEVEQVLVPVLQKQWKTQPLPLSIPALTKKAFRPHPRALLATRTAALGLVVLMFFFSAWQFVILGPSASGTLPQIVPSVPAPATISTVATATSEDCQLIVYRVQGNETISDIARRFSVSEEEIAALNSQGPATIRPAMELIIPVCNFTPTGTVHPKDLVNTAAPGNESTTSTPDG